MKFSRFGGLSAVKQTHYDVGEYKSFHNPPKRKGIYAFVYGYEESFLLGGSNRNVKGYSEHLKNKKGEILYSISDDKEIIETNFDHSILESNSFYKLWVVKDEGSEPLEDRKWRNFYKYYGSLTIDNDDGTTTTHYFKPPKRKVFDYDGEIWHHIDYKINKNEILDRNGSWVKTTMKTYEKALKRYILNNKLKSSSGNLILNSARKNGGYSLDDLEVFIEHLK